MSGTISPAGKSKYGIVGVKSSAIVSRPPIIGGPAKNNVFDTFWKYLRLN